MKVFDVIVVGGGVVGVGVVIILSYVGIENFVVLERYKVGVLFDVWLVEICFIILLFLMNFIGMFDFNLIVIGVFFVFSMEVEYFMGSEYVFYIWVVVVFFEVFVCENIDV